jgi:hypothetical protein
MTCCYVLIACVGYSKLGVDFDFTKPVTSVLPQDTWVVLMNLALLVRCIVAYLLNANIWIGGFLAVSLKCRIIEEWRGRVIRCREAREGVQSTSKG